jgi:hypothetical protein
MKNKNLLIGAGVIIVGYLLYKKSQNDERNKRVQNMSKLVNESSYYTSEFEKNNG